MKGNIIVSEVKSKKDLRDFIHLPARLHRKHRYWTAPLYKDEWTYYNPQKNRSHTYCTTVLFLAKINGKLVGRVMGIINNRYNDLKGEKTARFTHLESIDDELVVYQLLGSVEDWARKEGMNKVIGPYGFSNFDAKGLLVEGFEYPPSLHTFYNFPYLPKLVEQCGYEAEEGLSTFKIKVPKEIPEIYERIYLRAKERSSFEVLEFRSRDEMKPFVRKVVGLVNVSFLGIYGFSPLDEEEMDEIGETYLSILNPRLVKIGLKEGEVVSFVISMPSIIEGLRKAKGHLFPIGFIHILRAQRKSTQLDLLIGGIRPDCQGLGLDAIMGIKMIDTAHEMGFTDIDTHQEFDSNPKIQAEMRRVGGEVYKRYNIYRKSLDS